MKIITQIAIFSLVGTILYAQSKMPPALSTDRPDQTEAPQVVPEGYFQIESGIVLEKDNPSESNRTVNTYNFASTLLRYGIINDFELRLSASYMREDIQYAKYISSEAGLSDIDFGFKYHFLEEDGFIPESGVIASVIIPFGHKYFTEDKYVVNLLYTGANGLYKSLELGYNLGTVIRGNDPVTLKYSLVLGLQPLNKIGMFLELFGFANKDNSPAILTDFGMTYRVLPNLQLDTSYGLALNDIAVDSFFNFGLSWRFPR